MNNTVISLQYFDKKNVFIAQLKDDLTLVYAEFKLFAKVLKYPARIYRVNGQLLCSGGKIRVV